MLMLIHIMFTNIKTSLLLYFIDFRVNPTCTSLELVHKTTVDNVPTAICGFQGRVLIGIGRILRLYDIGKKKLLRKCENKVNYYYLCHLNIHSCLF